MFKTPNPRQSFPHDQDGVFNQWNEQKKNVEKSKKQVFFKERDVFYLRCGKNVGFEQNGKGEKFLRPVIVLKKFNNQIFWGIPVSTKTKIGKYYHSFFMNESEQMAIISQMRLFDGKRILDKLGMISNPDFLAIKQKIKELLE